MKIPFRRGAPHFRTIFVVAIVAVGIVLGLSTLTPPRVVSVDGPSTAFSAERAMRWVEDLSRHPHPPGSDEIARVRRTIISGLESLGYEPEIWESTVAVDHGTSAVASKIENIVVTIPGTDPSQAVLLDAHYDTRAMTPGAADNGTAVATLMEIARILTKEPPLRNDVILLFTDNEEYGAGLGAASFVENHPEIDTIGLVLNFEGLGHSGPSILFETGPNSGDAVRRWGRVTHRPVGQSWFPEIYKRTPIGTDLNRFSDAGVPGMNFGFWSEGTAYHTALDTPAALDPRSLQHHGNYALDMVRDYGNRDPAASPGKPGNMVYFNLLPGLLVRYPTTWALPLAILAGLLGIVTVTVGYRRKTLTIRGILAGLGTFTLNAVAAAGLSTGLWMLATRLHGEYRAMITFRGMVYNGHFYGIAFVVLAIALAMAFLVLSRRRRNLAELSIGALAFLWLMALATAIAAPGFAYLLTWPLVFSFIAWGAILLRRSPYPDKSVLPAVFLTLGAFPGILLFSAALPVMFHFALAPMIGILAFMAALLLGFLVPALDLATNKRPWIIAGGVGAICLVFLVIGSLTAGFTAEHPRPNAVGYLLDADAGEATWFSGGTERDGWTDQFLSVDAKRGTVGELYPLQHRSRFPVWRDSAPVLDLPAPEMSVVNDRRVGGSQVLDLHLASPRGAEIITVDVKPYGAIRSVRLAGKEMVPVDSARETWSLTYYAVPEEGFRLALTIDSSSPIDIRLSDQTWEIDDQVMDMLIPNYRIRGNDMMRMPNFDYGTVVVTGRRLE